MFPVDYSCLLIHLVLCRICSHPCGVYFQHVQVNIKSARVGIDTLIFLKEALKQAPVIAECLQPLVEEAELLRRSVPRSAQQQQQQQRQEQEQQLPLEACGELLVTLMTHNFNDSILAEMRADIDNTLIPSTTFSRWVRQGQGQGKGWDSWEAIDPAIDD